jgi:cell division protein FtsB
MNNNDNTNNKMLDALTILGFAAQIQNISDDKTQTEYIRKVIQVIADEIEKLHKENDIIIKQNEEILKMLGGGNKNGVN